MQLTIEKISQKVKNVRRWAKNPRHSKHKPVLAESQEKTVDGVINIADTIPPNKFMHRPVEFHETATGNYYLPAEAPDDVITSHIKTGKVFEPEIVEVAKELIVSGST